MVVAETNKQKTRMCFFIYWVFTNIQIKNLTKQMGYKKEQSFNSSFLYPDYGFIQKIQKELDKPLK